ncbi:hypothetical protein NYO99_06455 [Pelomonas sp. UHG3]|uniref:Uncharacterized protein n=1 Tax=Roseateles hydrophilus TaxID=2975054 RepID=A0ACC6C880_9BURK|nr:hypothetical protein [Pelomonas sp. UHG3]MCY4744610.1 hypothetical protein [Pelomonas sp. UHG3]
MSGRMLDGGPSLRWVDISTDDTAPAPPGAARVYASLSKRRLIALHSHTGGTARKRGSMPDMHC